MSYTNTVWYTGDIITAEKLNKIEEGVKTASVGADEAVVFSKGANLARNSKPLYSYSNSDNTYGDDTAWQFAKGNSAINFESKANDCVEFTIPSTYISATLVQYVAQYRTNGALEPRGSWLKDILVEGGDLWFSVDILNDSVVDILLCLQATYSDGTETLNVLRTTFEDVAATDSYVRYTSHGVIPEDFLAEIDKSNVENVRLLVQVSFDAVSEGAARSVKMKDFKLEYGSEATAYTYSDYDVNKIVSRVHELEEKLPICYNHEARILVKKTDDENVLKTYAQFTIFDTITCCISGAIFDTSKARMKISVLYQSPYNNSYRSVLVAQSTEYDPDTNGELTFDNATTKPAFVELAKHTSYKYVFTKAGAIANTSWYVRPVLKIGDTIYYGDTWKFDIDENNKITPTHITNTIGAIEVITSILYAERSSLENIALKNSSFYCLMYNSGMLEVNDGSYALINKSDFEEGDGALSLYCYCGDGGARLLDTVFPNDI